MPIVLAATQYRWKNIAAKYYELNSARLQQFFEQAIVVQLKFE